MKKRKDEIKKGRKEKVKEREKGLEQEDRKRGI